VVHVIDLCLTNHVQYVPSTGSTSPSTVFISKSQSDQRKGRAGRLRDGVIWRMMPRELYETLDKFETPAIKLLNLAKPVLLLLASKSPLLHRMPQVLLASCMDPPSVLNVQAALKYLVGIGAAERRAEGGLAVTTHGRLLIDMPGE
jgi:HrpA-like RNA helicase